MGGDPSSYKTLRRMTAFQPLKFSGPEEHRLESVLHKPAQGRPILEPRSDVRSTFGNGHFAGAESSDDSALEGPTLLQILQNGELFAVETAEIDHIVDAVNREIDRCGLKARDCGNFLAFLALFHSVAGHVGRRILFYGQEKIVDGIVKVE
jgi:hypothetical protein